MWCESTREIFTLATSLPSDTAYFADDVESTDFRRDRGLAEFRSKFHLNEVEDSWGIRKVIRTMTAWCSDPDRVGLVLRLCVSPRRCGDGFFTLDKCRKCCTVSNLYLYYYYYCLCLEILPGTGIISYSPPTSHLSAVKQSRAKVVSYFVHVRHFGHFSAPQKYR